MELELAGVKDCLGHSRPHQGSLSLHAGLCSWAGEVDGGHSACSLTSPSQEGSLGFAGHFPGRCWLQLSPPPLLIWVDFEPHGPLGGSLTWAEPKAGLLASEPLR